MKTKVNIRKELQSQEEKVSWGENLVYQIKSWLIEDYLDEGDILKNVNNSLPNSLHTTNFTQVENLPFEEFQFGQIKKVAIRYGLRFLPTFYFKGEIPSEAIFKIKSVQNQYQTKMKEFYILAPDNMFKLKDRNADPLLFVRLKNGNFGLIHQWGGDLSLWNRIKSWPMQNIFNLSILIAVFSFIVSILVPSEVFFHVEHFSLLSRKIVFFCWLFGIFVAFTTFTFVTFGFKLGKYKWNSPYFN